MSLSNRSVRWIPLDGAVNARAVVPGVLLRSDNLQALSRRDVRHLIDEQRLEVVIDLRSDVELELEGPGPMSAEARRPDRAPLALPGQRGADRPRG